MRVFVTGATGFIGSAVVKELLTAGHEVLGLVRSNAAAQLLTATGAKAHLGNLEDLESLRTGAAESDGVIHTAFVHDISHMSLNMRFRMLSAALRLGLGMSFVSAVVETEKRAIETLGAALAGTGRPLVISAGTFGLKPGHLGTEEDTHDPNQPTRRPCEELALSMVSRGVRASVLRLAPSVHDENKQGLVSYMIETARKKGVSAFVGDGQNRWSALHVLDAARLFRLALEKGSAGSRFHGVAEEGIPLREIAEVIGRRLNIPVVSKPADHFGFLKAFMPVDCPASSKLTQETLGWSPGPYPLLLADLERAKALEIRKK